MDGVELFNQHRPLLFGIAYRMLGSVMEAEDAVQETFLRWGRAVPGEVAHPKAYLASIVTRLCLDQLRSARVRREDYVGPWLPEPLLTEGLPDALRSPAMSESLSIAFLVLLESLTPTERAIFLLREVFEYDYAEIAAIVGKGEANCRQIVRRARQTIEARRPRFTASPEQRDRLVAQFMQACATGDLPGLVAVLADDITLWSDGGGKVSAARKPIHGADAVARFFHGVLRKAPPTFRVTLAEVNGQPGLISWEGDTILNVVSFHLTAEGIQGIHLVANPDKLEHLSAGER